LHPPSQLTRQGSDNDAPRPWDGVEKTSTVVGDSASHRLTESQQFHADGSAHSLKGVAHGVCDQLRDNEADLPAPETVERDGAVDQDQAD
jgi:hypothetical protein